uniref:Uncharacterized protein n=1 Tax=Lygus hesperus TaxID=30085 RepID=A0A146LH20_LYGHE
MCHCASFVKVKQRHSITRVWNNTAPTMVDKLHLMGSVYAKANNQIVALVHCIIAITLCRRRRTHVTHVHALLHTVNQLLYMCSSRRVKKDNVMTFFSALCGLYMTIVTHVI